MALKHLLFFNIGMLNCLYKLFVLEKREWVKVRLIRLLCFEEFEIFSNTFAIKTPYDFTIG